MSRMSVHRNHLAALLSDLLSLQARAFLYTQAPETNIASYSEAFCRQCSAKVWCSHSPAVCQETEGHFLQEGWRAVGGVSVPGKHSAQLPAALLMLALVLFLSRPPSLFLPLLLPIPFLLSVSLSVSLCPHPSPLLSASLSLAPLSLFLPRDSSFA